MSVFTIDGLERKKFKAPPVKGCGCTYCANITMYGKAIDGHGCPPSHRLADGDEHHNPENIARIALAKLVTKAQFKEYTSKPGGATLTFVSKNTGLTYVAGRGGPVDASTRLSSGHFIEVRYNDKHLEWLCVPCRRRDLPLAGIVMTHYLAVMNDERGVWSTATWSKRLIADYFTPPKLSQQAYKYLTSGD